MPIVPPSCRACLVMSLKAASAAAARARSDKSRVGHYSGVDTCEHRDLVHQRRVGTAPTEGRKWDFSTVCCGRDLTAPRTTDRSSRIQASWLLDWIRERYTSMTIPDSHASASDETGRPEAHRVRDWGRTGGPPTASFTTRSSATRGTTSIRVEKIERGLETFPLPREIRTRLRRRHLNPIRDKLHIPPGDASRA